MQEEYVSHRRSVPPYIGAGRISTASHYAVTIAGVERHAVPLALLMAANAWVFRWC